jgi:outer membrane receptor protein involved in Fe transport
MSQLTLRRNALTSALAFTLVAPAAAFAQAAPDQSNDKSNTQELEKVTVTGSRIKRVEIEGAAPVVTLTAEDIKRQGFSTVIEALQSLTQVGLNPQPDVLYGSHAPGAKPLNLRMIGSGRSLLLVNGRRVADYPEPAGGQSNFSNYGNIPAAAIDRIEVLATGASAIYGSDAVAGVINIILKKNFQGDQVSVRGGGTELGGGSFNDFQWVGGKSGDNWSVTYALENFRRKPITGNDRPFMDSSTDKPKPIWSDYDRAAGSPVEGIGIRMIDGETGKRIAPPNGAATCDQFWGFNYYHRQTYTRTGLGQGTLNDRGYQCGQLNDFGANTLDNGNNNQHGYVYGTWNFSNDLQAFGSLAVYETKTTHQTDAPFVDLLSDSTWFDPGMKSAAHPNGTYALSAIRVFTPAEVGSWDDYRNHTRDRYIEFTGGLRGRVLDRFDWEASVGRSQDHTHESYLQLLPGPVNDFFLGPQLGTLDDGTPIYKLDQQKWWNPLTPAQFASIKTHVVNEASSWINQASASVTGDLFQGWAGPIGWAAEAEAARQGYSLSPDMRLVNGDFGGNDDLGFVDQGGGSRDRYALGTEFRVPVTHDFTANLGARWDKYNAVKNASNVSYMAGLEYRPIDSLLLRGSYATSFRAPDMHYTYALASSQQSRIQDFLLCRQQGSYPHCDVDTPYTHEVNVVRQGSTDLDYEKGHSFSYGLVWNAMDNLSVTADYWNIFLKNTIQDVSEQDELNIEYACAYGPLSGGPPPTAEQCAFVKTRIHRDANGNLTSVERGPINQGGSRRAGVDASLKYRFETASFGNFNFGLDYTLITKYQDEARPGDPWTDNRPFNIRSRVRGSVDWTYGKFNATVLGTRTTGLRSVHYGDCQPLADGFMPDSGQGCVDPLTGLTAGRNHTVGVPAIFWNLGLGYQLNDHARLNLYITDVFNKADVQDPYKLDYSFTWDNQYNQIGRAYSLEFVYKF